MEENPFVLSNDCFQSDSASLFTRPKPLPATLWSGAARSRLKSISQEPASMRMQLRAQLAFMMFLQYAVWGAWMPILSATLINRGIQPVWVGGIYTALWLGCMVTPFI